MKYNNIDYQRSVLICMVVMIHIVNFSTLYPDVKNFITFHFMGLVIFFMGLTSWGQQANCASSPSCSC